MCGPSSHSFSSAVVFYPRSHPGQRPYPSQPRDSRSRPCNSTTLPRIQDFIGNKLSAHNLRRCCLRARTRRLCRLQPSSMARSEKFALVLRSVSLSTRARLTPARLCSTRTGVRARWRLCCFSPGPSSPSRGFFSAGVPRRRAGDSLGSRCHLAREPAADRQSVPRPPFPCRAPVHDRSGSESRCAWFSPD